MAKGEYLGEFEQIVLLALLRLGAEAYGLRVRQEIAERTGRDVAIGAVYATLDRLETKGYVTSRVAGPTPERGGRAKRYFEVIAEGRRALAEAQHSLAQMREGLTEAWRLP